MTALKCLVLMVSLTALNILVQQEKNVQITDYYLSLNGIKNIVKSNLEGVQFMSKVSE